MQTTYGKEVTSLYITQLRMVNEFMLFNHLRIMGITARERQTELWHGFRIACVCVYASTSTTHLTSHHLLKQRMSSISHLSTETKWSSRGNSGFSNSDDCAFWNGLWALRSMFFNWFLSLLTWTTFELLRSGGKKKKKTFYPVTIPLSICTHTLLLLHELNFVSIIPLRGITHVLLLFILLLRAWFLTVVLINYQSSSSVRITFICLAVLCVL